MAGLCHQCWSVPPSLLSDPIAVWPIPHAAVTVNLLLTKLPAHSKTKFSSLLKHWSHFYCPLIKGQVLIVTNKSLLTIICPKSYCGRLVLGSFGVTKIFRCSNALYKRLWYLYISYIHPPLGFKLHTISWHRCYKDSHYTASLRGYSQEKSPHMSIQTLSPQIFHW